MDWTLATKRNREALTRIVATLFAMAGLSQKSAGTSIFHLGADKTEGGVSITLPYQLYRAILLILRPAEAAMRRLIILAAHGLVVQFRLCKAMPFVITKGNGTSRPQAFRLFDPLKPFRATVVPAYDFEYDFDEHEPEQSILSVPRISVKGLFAPAFMAPPAVDVPQPFSTQRLCRRLQALQHARANLHKQARRLARWRSKRDFNRSRAPRAPGRFSPLRPGHPPGHRLKSTHEIDDILRECHGLVMARLTGDTS